MSKLSSEARKTSADRARRYASAIDDVTDDALEEAARGDPVSPPISNFDGFRPLIDADPAFVERVRRGRGPQRSATKTAVSLRLDQDVVEHFRASGPGWQSRVNDALRKVAGL